MNTIECPKCGKDANAFGSPINCWCDKQYCDHLTGMFSEYKCKHCGSNGETPQLTRHKEIGYAKFQAELAKDDA